MDEIKPNKKIRLFIFLITALYVLIMVPASIATLITPKIMDSINASDSFSVAIPFYLIATFPIVIIISLIAAWILYLKQKYEVAFWTSFAPLLEIILVFILFLYFA